MIYARPGQAGSKFACKPRYENYINGRWAPPIGGRYTESIAPSVGRPYCEVPRSDAADVEAALDAAHAAKDAWGRVPPAERAVILNKIADRIEANKEVLAVAESWDKGKMIRDVLNRDVPSVANVFRYYAACVRTAEGHISEIDHDTVCYHFHEPLGVVAAIIPWNFPLNMAAWKLGPALAGGNCIVLKPASLTPVSALVLAEIIGDLLPPGVLNILIGPGAEIGKALATNPRIAKVALTGETTTGRLIMQYAAENIIPVTLELGGKSPNVFFADVMAEDDALLDRALEGFSLFCYNSGEICTLPSRALIQESIYDRFMERAVARVAKIKQGNPLDTEMRMGPQVSLKQLERTMSYVDIGRKEGAEVLFGGERNVLPGEFKDGYYHQPTILRGHNKMRVFQEEIFGPVLCVTTFKDQDEAIRIANDTIYGLGAGVWTRDLNRGYRMGRAIQAGRVWVNTYLGAAMHSTFGGYKMSGLGRENYTTTVEQYQQEKCVHVSYSEQTMGLF
jgi:aldehyde dehydrogenase